MKKVRVLQLNKRYMSIVGGIERIVQQVAEGTTDEFEMTVVTCSKSLKRDEKFIRNVRVISQPSLGTIGGSLPIPVGYLSQVRKQAKHQDVILLHMPFPIGDLACLLSGFKGTVLVWWHSDVVRQKKLLKLYRPIMERMLKRADAIIVATEGHIEGSAYLKPYKDKCRVIPYGVDIHTELAAQKYLQAKENHKIHMSNYEDKNKKGMRFLFVGRLVYYKGCKTLLEAFQRMENAELVMVGKGRMGRELKQIVSDSPQAKNITFLGEITEMELYRQYEMCDVFVLPSIFRSEAFGLVQIEAMAFGKPVINTALKSGVPYVGIDKITGLTVPVGDSNALYEAMKYMQNHEQERLKMGENARKRVVEKFYQDRMLNEIKKLIKEITQIGEN